ncbi:MAG: hypothetical protein SV062_02915 [Thermodesulfobacteriota bacterium]|nr:hypothetical protein [Thermodesulfobacteriota bacterium]
MKYIISLIKSTHKIINLNLSLIVLVSILYLIFFLYCSVFQLFENYFEKWKAQLKVRLFLTKGIDKTHLVQIEKKLQGFYEIEKINFIAGDTIKKDLDERFNSLSGITTFSDSYELTPQREYRNPEGLKDISIKLKRIKGVEEVEYGQDWIYDFNSLIKKMRYCLLIGGIVLLLLITISLFFSFKIGFTPLSNKRHSAMTIGFAASLFALLILYTIRLSLLFLIRCPGIEPDFAWCASSFLYQGIIMISVGTLWAMECGMVTGKFRDSLIR